MSGTHDKDAEYIIDTMMSILAADDGPALPANQRKRRNGAEQFYEDYQEEYENRAKEQDRVSRARNHNSLYPKLHDELGKRKSITKVTTIDGRRVPADYDPRCSACVKLITLNELQRKHLKNKCQVKEVSCRIEPRRRERMSQRESESRQIGDRRSRISKVKSNLHSRRSFEVFTVTKTGRCKSIQCSSSSFVRHQISGTCNSPLLLKNSNSGLSDKQSLGQNSRTSQNKSLPENVTNPGSKEPSVTSYNSFKSDNHEPMVS